MIKASDVLTYTDQFKEVTVNQSQDSSTHEETITYKDTILFNDSILHASILTGELFKKALSEGVKRVNMFCGKFSLFRDETKAKIDNVKIGCDISDLTEQEDRDKWQRLDPYNELQEQISEFLSDNQKGVLNLIIERELESLKKCSIWKTLKAGIENGRVKLSIIHERLGIGHFTVTEDAYRIEASDDNKTAIACFQDKENADILNDNFEFLQRISEPVSI